MFSSTLQSINQQITNLKKNRLNDSNFEYTTLSAEIEPMLSLIPATEEKCFFWSKPAQSHTMIGFDVLVSFSTRGHSRFNSLKHNYDELLKHWSENQPPVAFIAFAFDADDPMQGCWSHFPNSILTVPRIIIEEKNNIQRILINLHVEQTDAELDELLTKISITLSRFTGNAEKKLCSNTSINKNSPLQSSSLSKKHWLRLTQNAILSIISGDFDKLVSTRQLSVLAAQAPDIQQLLAKLINYYPSCTIFSYQSDHQTFLTASPERLLSLNNRHISSDAIGGTIDPCSKLNSRFNNDKEKLLNEHAIIAEDIYNRLDPYCNELQMPLNPIYKKLHNMYHLETPISGQLRAQENIFDVIAALHPTPAIAGHPAQKAQRWLIQNECYNRGWYTGAFGWISGTDRGELSVFLRCALINKNVLQLFAGAGLVAESDAEQEWQETELKMNTILDML